MLALKIKRNFTNEHIFANKNAFPLGTDALKIFQKLSHEPQVSYNKLQMESIKNLTRIIAHFPSHREYREGVSIMNANGT